MIVDCKCKECSTDYKFSVVEVCSACLIKKILPQRKYSIWKMLKEFSWFCLILMPVSIIIGLELGGIHQFIFSLGFLAFPIVNGVARWCADKF